MNVKNIIIALLIIAGIVLGLFWLGSYKKSREYRKSIEQLGTEINSYKELNTNLSAKNKKLERTVTALREQLELYRNRIEKARKIATELQTGSNEISGELSKAIEQIQRIKKELQALKEQLEVDSNS